MHSLCAVIWYFTGKALSYIIVQYHSALLAHARPTMFYIPLVVLAGHVSKCVRLEDNVSIVLALFPAPHTLIARDDKWCELRMWEAVDKSTHVPMLHKLFYSDRLTSCLLTVVVVVVCLFVYLFLRCFRGPIWADYSYHSQYPTTRWASEWS